MKQVIGSVVMTYTQDGILQSANVQPITEVPMSEDLKKRMTTVPCSNNSETIRQNAQVALGAWFSKMTDLELADRAQYKVVSEVTDCVQHDNGRVKQCTIKFTLQPIV